MAEETKSTATAGVQELIDRVRDQGVKAARDESEVLLREARQKAKAILDEARAEAEQLDAKTRAEIDAYRTASMDALKLAARDTVLELKSGVMSRFEEFVKRLVVSATRDKELVKSIVLVLAGKAATELIKDKDIEVRISNALLTGKQDLEEEAKLAILGLSSDMLREGIQLVPDSEIEGGARVRLKQDKLEIDLSDRAISRMIAQRLLPRFKAILEGAEE